MKKELSPGVIVGIIAVAVILIGGLGFYFYNKSPYGTPPPIPMKPGATMQLPTGASGGAPSPGMGGGSPGPSMGGGGAMRAPGAPP